MAKAVIHQCNKETDIALMQKDMTYMKEKIDELHHKLLGNGKPGILEEQNKRIDAIEKKVVAWGAVIGVILILLNLFGTRIVTALLGE